MAAPRLIVGLGNPGMMYRGTRHNLGFLIAEAFGKRHRIAFRQKAYKGRFGEGQVGGRPVALLLPMTYMNLSGEAVAAARKGMGIRPEEILVIADDMDLPTGQLRLRDKGSSGGHNGLRSIIDLLGTEGFARLKVGISHPSGDMVVDWVLGYFSREEHTLVSAAIPKAVEVLTSAVTQGIQAAQVRISRDDPA